MKKTLLYIVVMFACLSISSTLMAEEQINNNSFIRDDLIYIKQNTTESATIKAIDTTTINSEEQNYQENTNDNANVDTQTQNAQKDAKDTNSQQAKKEQNNETKKPPKWWRQRGSYFGFGHAFD